MNVEERLKPSPRSSSGRWILPLALFGFALFVNLYGLGWGLPNGNDTWAADSIRPGAPLAILYRTLIGDELNSGWFWFKYPLGHVFILGAAYAPYLAWLKLTGGLGTPTSEFPHGFADPEAAMMTLALLGRATSAIMGAGSVVLVYLCLVRSFGRLAAASAALASALCYPMVYYSHTTNVEVPYVFWMLAALLGAIRIVEGSPQRRWWILLGVGAAASVATKEIVAGIYVGLAPALAVGLLSRSRAILPILRGGLIAGVTFAIVLLLASNALLNPSGFLNRLGFLTQTLDPEIALQYAPYYFPIELGASRGLSIELTQLATATRRILESVGAPIVVLALGGLVLAAKQAPRTALLIAASAAGFYLVGVRAMLSLSMRYVLPLAVFASMLAGISVARLAQEGRRATIRRPLAVAAVLFMMLYGWDVNRMFSGDGRYAAEAWIRNNVEQGAIIEVYQRPTYLPRISTEYSVRNIDFTERDVDGFRKRQPDYVVLSSAGISGVTVEYKEDWATDEEAPDDYDPSQIGPGGQVMNYSRRDNTEFLDRLIEGSLGYVEAARFSVNLWIDRPLIQSLNPEITIFKRAASTSSDTDIPQQEARLRLSRAH
ncbi:MAG: hypothetical protein ACI8TX_002533 [Hyphomicrobiaceae bacterium]|jgi:hypothetical protein